MNRTQIFLWTRCCRALIFLWPFPLEYIRDASLWHYICIWEKCGLSKWYHHYQHNFHPYFFLRFCLVCNQHTAVQKKDGERMIWHTILPSTYYTFFHKWDQFLVSSIFSSLFSFRVPRSPQIIKVTLCLLPPRLLLVFTFLCVVITRANFFMGVCQALQHYFFPSNNLGCRFYFPTRNNDSIMNLAWIWLPTVSSSSSVATT